MASKLRIPIYSDLPPKKKQWVNMIGGGLLALSAVLIVSGFIGDPKAGNGGASRRDEPPKPKPLSSVPGQQLNAKDVWVGGAAKDVVGIREDVKAAESKSRERDERQDREVAELKSKLEALMTEKGASERASKAAERAEPAPRLPPAVGSPPPMPLPPPASTGTAANAPASLGQQPRTGRLPQPGGPTDYPPGQPNGPAGTPVAMAVAPRAPGPGLIRVTNKAAEPSEPAAAKPAAGQAGQRHVDNFLPVSYTRAVLLGGVAAPTGGQAQSNPVPVLLRLLDKAVLPNQYRADIKDCLVVAEAHGDHSSERAYVRTTLLSCVMNDGSVIEVPIKGGVFGEDGMNGIAGTLVQKQGQILANALMAGIASGIGSGLAQSAQSIATSPLGSVTTPSTDTTAILKQGVGTGVGKALDRLSQYYISLAEKTFPVIEVQPGRKVDVLIQMGVAFDATPASASKTSGGATKAGGKGGAGDFGIPNARQLLRTSLEQDDE
jgi:conjugal transfer pilus assembly protein TraB